MAVGTLAMLYVSCLHEDQDVCHAAAFRATVFGLDFGAPGHLIQVFIIQRIEVRIVFHIGSLPVPYSIFILAQILSQNNHMNTVFL